MNDPMQRSELWEEVERTAALWTASIGVTYPVIPVELILRHRFDTLSLVSKITAPTYIVASEKDRVIPSTHAENLVNNWKGPLEFYLVPGGVHDESFYPPETFSRLQKFFGAN